MKTKGNLLLVLYVIVCLLFLSAPSLSSATIIDPVTANNYCIVPPFIESPITPNLLLMIDSSASMYDPQYQDKANTYCANAPTTSCTPGTTCGGNATCVGSMTTSVATTWSIKACNVNADCPHSTTQHKSCKRDADCPKSNSCSSGSNKVCGAADDIPPCNLNYCSNCNLSAPDNTTQDCTSSITTTYTADTCTTDADCTKVPNDICNNKCNLTRKCYDTTYDNTKTYYGYFDNTATALYSYDFINNKFTGGATMPGTCTYSSGTTKYFCVNTSGTGTSEAVVEDSTGFVASGNFLNWLTTTKFDIEKQILTGGKFDTTNNVLIGETRGCDGRKFIKAISGVNLTFAIRGGTPGGISSTQNQATEYGQTYIEIYAGAYNTKDCLNAMNDWMTLTTNPVNLGSFQNDTKGCVGAGNSQYNAINVWNHILHDCYQGILGQAQGYSTNLGPLEGECTSAYAAGVAPSSITDPNSGIAICSSVLSYTDPGGVARIGYLGACYDGATFNSTCALMQMTNYCLLNVNTNPVVDPDSTSLTGAGSSAPGFILEQGLMNTTKVGTLTVKIGLNTPPSGLISQYKERIRFGAMTFQNMGSGSECSSTSGVPCMKTCSVTKTRVCFFNTDCPTGETCVDTPKTDGGKIISYVGAGACSTSGAACDVDSECPAGQTCKASVGSHSSGLINKIDSIVASTWTPFAEAFYNTIGYFARTNAYASPPTTPTSADFNFTGLPAAYDVNKNPSQVPCQKNNVLLVTDGMSTADINPQVDDGLATAYAPYVPLPYTNAHGYDTSNSCPRYKGSRSLPTLAWVAQKRNIKLLIPGNAAISTIPAKPSESISTFVVYSGPSSGSATACDPYTLMQATANNGGTTLLPASNPSQLNSAIDTALAQVAAKSASGTAASVLASGEGSGANLLQAIFYPKKEFEGGVCSNALATVCADDSTCPVGGTCEKEISWTGTLHNLWYYVDPRVGSSSIRENTAEDSATEKDLNLDQDDIIKFSFCTVDAGCGTNIAKNTTYALRYASDAAGNLGAQQTSVPLDNLKYLWETGKQLHGRDPSTRTIWTQTGGALTDFQALDTSSATVQGLLQAGNDVEAGRIIKYVAGYNRFCSGTANECDDATCSGAAVCKNEYRNRIVQKTYTENGVSTTVSGKTWKLGDIVDSTPRLATWVPLNNYDRDYHDHSYTAFLNSDAYKNRGRVVGASHYGYGMVFVGANDGMLHAFELGALKVVNDNSSLKASLIVDSASDLGKEKWAFVPKNALPYLKYLMDPNYGHLYYVDSTAYLFDASICDPGSCSGNYWDQAKPQDGSSWRTILIGGTKYGGAAKDAASTYGVKIPVSGSGQGFSSYFALDITDNLKDHTSPPVLLWEFSDPQLGFSTSGPSIVRINAKNTSGGITSTVPDTNGRWFAVFASGPTGPIDTTNHQFQGYSDQELKLFVMDLKQGPAGGVTVIPTGISNAFAGSLNNSSTDYDMDYQDDAIYLGYTKSEDNTPSATTKWTQGGILRLITRAKITEGLDPANWKVSTVIDDIGAVTSAVGHLAHYHAKNPKPDKAFLFFGTGRYFFKSLKSTDDTATPRAIYGIKEPCLNTITSINSSSAPACETGYTVAAGDLSDTTTTVLTSEPAAGWFINLDDTHLQTNPANNNERVITDTVATPTGAVYFTTYAPVNDSCSYGGNTYLWATKYDTGGSVASSLKGKALLQVSTGEIKEIDLKDAFKTSVDNPDSKGERRTKPMEGVPPGPGLSVIVPPKPIDTFIHIRKK